MLIPSLFLAGCWDTSVHPIPINAATEQRIFNSSIQSANNRGHGYFVISVPAYVPEDSSDEGEPEAQSETEEAPEEFPAIRDDAAYALLYIGRYASDEPEEFLVEATSEGVTITKMADSSISFSVPFGRSERAFFRFDWTYSDALWDLRYGETQIISDLRLEDGENISVSSFEYIPDDAVPGEDGSYEALPYPEGMQIDAIYNYFQN